MLDPKIQAIVLNRILIVSRKNILIFNNSAYEFDDNAKIIMMIKIEMNMLRTNK